MHNKPQVLSFLTCDGVHFDNASGKYFLLGVFSGIRAMQFPVVHPRMYWFLTLTDVSTGTHNLTVSMNLPTEPAKPIIKKSFKSRSPGDRIHIVNELNNLNFEAPGDFGIIIEVDDDLLMATSFQVSELRPPPQQS